MGDFAILLGLLLFAYHAYKSMDSIDCVICHELYNQMRLEPGLNNLSGTLLMLLLVSSMTYLHNIQSENYVGVTRWGILIVFLALCFVYPSRQLVLSCLIMIPCYLFPGKKNYYNWLFKLFIFIIIILLLLEVSGILHILISRVIKNSDQGNSYSRIVQLETALNYFLEYPLFGVPFDPYPELESLGVGVFENSYSDLAVRHGIAGYAAIFVILYILTRNWPGQNWLYVIPMLVISLFNEHIYEESFWIVIFLVCIFNHKKTGKKLHA